MKMQEVRARAKKMDMKTGGRKKADIIRAIQVQEGNAPCFAPGKNRCDQLACCWREACVTKKAR